MMQLKPAGLKKNLKQHLSENRYLYLILVFAVVFKLITVQMIGTDGDSGHAWMNAKYLAYGGPYSPTHISTRMGMILPAVLVLKIFGSFPLAYYIAPLIFYLLTVIFSFRLIRHVTENEVIAFWSVFLLCCFPNVIDSGNQLKTEIFSIALVFMAVFYLFKHMEKGNSVIDFSLSLMFLFWAYLAKETNILFMPPMLLVMLARMKKLRPAVLYAFILFILFMAETLIYRHFYDAPLGRLSIISSSALDKDILQPVKTVFHLFLRFLSVRPFWYPLFIIGLPGMFWIFFTEKSNRRLREMIFIFAGFLLLLTFSVKSVFPLIPALPFIERYFDVVLPFLFLVIVFLCGKLPVKLIKSRKSFRFHAAFISVILIIGGFVYQYVYLNIAYPSLKGSFFTNYPLKEVVSFHGIINDAYEKGIPIITPKTEPLRYKIPYDRVNILVESGLDLEKACEKTGITLNYYNYCKKRVVDGDYKAWLSFKYFFVDYSNVIQGRVERFPEFNIIDFDGWKYGVIIDGRFYNGLPEGASEYLKNSGSYVWMDVNPFKVEIRYK